MWSGNNYAPKAGTFLTMNELMGMPVLWARQATGAASWPEDQDAEVRLVWFTYLKFTASCCLFDSYEEGGSD